MKLTLKLNLNSANRSIPQARPGHSMGTARRYCGGRAIQRRAPGQMRRNRLGLVGGNSSSRALGRILGLPMLGLSGGRGRPWRDPGPGLRRGQYLPHQRDELRLVISMTPAAAAVHVGEICQAQIDQGAPLLSDVVQPLLRAPLGHAAPAVCQEVRLMMLKGALHTQAHNWRVTQNCHPELHAPPAFASRHAELSTAKPASEAALPSPKKTRPEG